MALAVALAVALMTAGLVLILTVVPSLKDTRTGVSELDGSLAGRLLADDVSRLDDLVRTTSAIEADLAPAATSVRWVGRFSPAFSWLPMARQEMAAWAAEMERVEEDMAAATSLVDSSAQLLAIYEDSRSSHDGADLLSSADLDNRIRHLRDSFKTSRDSVIRAANTDLRFSLLMQVPEVQDWTGLLTDLESKMMAASDLGHEVSALLAQVLDIIDRPSSSGGVPAGGLLDDDYSLVELLGAFADNQAEISESLSSVERARQALSDAVGGGSSTFSANLSDLTDLVEELETGLKLVGAIAPIAGPMLGADGTRRYLVLGQSADELRATGGFVSSVWLVVFENGQLQDIVYQDAVAVDDWERLELYPVAPPGLEQHMNAWVWLLRDVSWDPDFPTTARTAEDMYLIGRRQDVDGVIAINQWTLLRLVEALGSVEPPGADEPITSRNLLPALEEGTDRHGRAFMDLVLQGLLERFEQPVSFLSLTRLASGLLETLERRDTLVYFDDEDLQEVVSSFGWDGGVRHTEADYLYVVDSNVGWSKVDRNVQRGISYVVDLRKIERPRSSLTLKYSNHSGPGSPACDPQWLNRGTNYSQLKNACYWNFLRVYLPQGSQLLSRPELPLPEHSVSVEIGLGTPGQETSGLSSSHRKTVFSGLESIEAGERAEVNLVYDLPLSVLERDGNGLSYSLLIQKQPGVRQRMVSVEIKVPDGYELKSGSQDPARTGSGTVGFDITLERDTWLDVVFQESSGG